jgi:choline dehydrogenase-like flavoprotein
MGEIKEVMDMIQNKQEVDVCVIGAGPSGPAIAKHLREADLSVVMLEAGREYDYPNDFNALPLETIQKLSFPLKKKTYPYMADLALVDGQWHLFYIDANGTLILQDGQPVPLYTMTPEGPVLTPPPGGAVENKDPFMVRGSGPGGTSLIDSGVKFKDPPHDLDRWDALGPLPGYNPDDPQSPRWRYELVPYFEYLENYLPMPDSKGLHLTTQGALLVTGAKNTIISPTHPDYYDLKDMLPENDEGNLYVPAFDWREWDDPSFTDTLIGNDPGKGGYGALIKSMTSDCRHCGNCNIGCAVEVKKSSAVTFVPDGEQIGVELRAESMCFAVLHPDPAVDGSGNPYPIIVIYGTVEFDPVTKLPKRIEDPDEPERFPLLKIKELWAQPAKIVSLAAGGIESPRLWMQSNALCNDQVWLSVFEDAISGLGLDSGLYIKETSSGNFTLPPNPHVGKGMVCDDLYYVYGIFDKPILPQFGRCMTGDVVIPGYGGVMEYSYVLPLEFATHSLQQEGTPSGFGGEPWQKFGKDKKPFDQEFLYRCGLWTFVEDTERLEHNRIFLDPYEFDKIYVADLGSTLGIPIPAMQYVPPEHTKEAARKFQKLSVEILKNAAENSELTLEKYYVLGNERSAAASFANTLGLGKVVNSDCEALDGEGNVIERLYVTDPSSLPSTINGGPVLTSMAFALRAAEGLTIKYRDFLFTDDKWHKWEQKMIGPGHFIE